MKFTKKEELRVLGKFLDALHGEDCRLTYKVAYRILSLAPYDDLDDLKKRYKSTMKDPVICLCCEYSHQISE